MTVRAVIYAYMPVTNATARQRAYLPAEGVRKCGIDVTVKAPLRVRSYRRYATPRWFGDRVMWATEMLLRRTVQVLRHPKGTIAVVQRELVPFGPPLLEKVLAVRASRLVLDLDDAVHAERDHRQHSHIGRLLLRRDKLSQVIALSDVVVAGCPNLVAYAQALGAPVTLVPTCVEYPDWAELEHRRRSRSGGEVLRVGWLGNAGNLAALAMIRGPIAALRDRGTDVELVVMCNRAPGSDLDVGPATFLPWSLEGEEAFLDSIDVGVMPLADDEYTACKCGFKVLRYIAAGVPVAASPVGVNRDIIVSGETGFLASDGASWRASLEAVARMTAAERIEMGKRAYDRSRSSFGLDRSVREWRRILGGLG